MHKYNYNQIVHHTKQDFEAMHKAGRLAAETLDYITEFVVPGVTTAELDQKCHDFMVERGAVPGTLGYRGYQHSSCISINHVVCHGIPSDKKLRDGDIVNIDVTPIVDGWYGDTSRMYYVGNVGIKARKLVEVTYECLMRSIDVVKPGATLGDVGHAIQSHAESKGFSVVTEFCGHGLGQIFHDQNINVLHFGRPGTGMVLEEGMFFTIEPMINAGKAPTKILSDGWTAVTKDKSLSAQFEHSLGVTADGCEIFTSSPKGYTLPPYGS